MLTACCTSGCDGDDSGAALNINGNDPSSCNRDDFLACDIARSDCQEAVFSAVRCMRGNLGSQIPQARTLSKEEFRQELLDASAELDPEYEARTQLLYGYYALLGLAGPNDGAAGEQVDAQVENIAAFYDPVNEGVTVIEQDTSEENASGVAPADFLAHEYVHALQDQEHGLQSFYPMNPGCSDSRAFARSRTFWFDTCAQFRIIANKTIDATALCRSSANRTINATAHCHSSANWTIASRANWLRGARCNCG